LERRFSAPGRRDVGFVESEPGVLQYGGYVFGTEALAKGDRRRRRHDLGCKTAEPLINGPVMRVRDVL
jgi:hypothetical protein